MHKTARKYIIILTAFAALSVVSSCKQREKVDFSKINKEAYYHGKMPDKKTLFLKFLTTNGSNADGICFYDEDRAIANKGTFSIKKGKTLTSEIDKNKNKYEGLFSINEDSLIFITSENEKIHFAQNIKYEKPDSKRRYRDEVFEKLTRTEVTYGKASGFYQSKPADNMSSDAYPKIILEVSKSILMNFFNEPLSLKMDIYQPKDDSIKLRPLIVLLHGGAFILGSNKDDYTVRLAKYFGKRGYVVACINYRLGYVFLPGVYSNLERCIYKAIQDSRAAIRYLVHNKTQYGIDKNNIYVAGNSAGGIIALNTAFMTDDEAFESVDGDFLKLQNSLGCLDCSTNDYHNKFKIKGVVNMWGALTDIDIIDPKENIATLSIHGDSDRIVPYDYNYPFQNVDKELSSFFVKKMYGSKIIDEKLKQYNTPSTLITIKGGTHEPQSDKDNKYTETFTLIKNEINKFLFGLVSSKKVTITGANNIAINDKSDIYKLKNAPKGQKCHWEIEGGTYISQNKNNSAIKVFWFDDESTHTLKTYYTNENGLIMESDVFKINMEK